MRKAFSQAELAFTEIHMPLERALRHFESGKSDCIYTMADAIANRAHLKSDQLLSSYPFNSANLHLFTLQTKPKISNLQQVAANNHLIVGLNGYLGYYSDEIIREEVYGRLVLVTDEERALNMLRQNRVDVLIGFMPDYTRHLNELHYDKSFSLGETLDGLTCRTSDLGIATINALSLVFKDMHKDGLLEKILGDEFIDFTYTPKHPYDWLSQDLSSQ
ncbi:hypothetical protein [Lacimicrobium sp. SS2-24]|uniref:hypothetical protein n=1 Tax=Lacimicrobium sp. SS2-24 TaxID=2005569 RepID=UPI00112FEC10|nr:hypothetical protein [Lacimicrobium sp. SS2-24]